MAAYLIGDIEITDPEGYKEYIAKAPKSIAEYGGTYLVRGGPHEVLEGEWKPHRMVVVEFPDMLTLREWYDSPEYSEIRTIRQRCTTGSLMVVEGA